MSKLYYTPPTEEQFNELKKEAIEIWNTYGNEYGYVDEKVNSIKNITNVQDNFMYMVAMFDVTNQRKLADRINDETKLAIRERMIDGGQPEHLIFF